MPTEVDLGFTGTRKGMTDRQAVSFRMLARLFYGQFHEGDCIGADEDAAGIIDSLDGFFFHIHPPINYKYRANFIPKNSQYRMWTPKSYAERDLDMVYESDVMAATPKGFKEEKIGSGTWLTIRMARAELCPLAIIWPDGRIEYERWVKQFGKVRVSES